MYFPCRLGFFNDKCCYLSWEVDEPWQHLLGSTGDGWVPQLVCSGTVAVESRCHHCIIAHWCSLPLPCIPFRE
jgi:hypothetical protein